MLEYQTENISQEQKDISQFHFESIKENILSLEKFDTSIMDYMNNLSFKFCLGTIGVVFSSSLYFLWKLSCPLIIAFLGSVTLGVIIGFFSGIVVFNSKNFLKKIFKIIEYLQSQVDHTYSDIEMQMQNKAVQKEIFIYLQKLINEATVEKKQHLSQGYNNLIKYLSEKRYKTATDLIVSQFKYWNIAEKEIIKKHQKIEEDNKTVAFNNAFLKSIDLPALETVNKEQSLNLKNML